MRDLAFQQILTMQFTIAILLVIVNLQATRVFRTSAFRFIAFGWLANLAYLVGTSLAATSTAQQHIPSLLGSRSMEPFAIRHALDFIANSFFWYAAHKYGRSRNPLFLSKLPDYLFGLALLLLYSVSVTLAHFLPQEAYSNFFLAALPIALLDMIALISLAFYLKEHGERVSKAVHSGLPFRATLLYAFIQPLQLLAHPTKRTSWDVYSLGFVLGFIAKMFLLFGMVRIFVASAETVVDAIAERKRTKQLVDTIDKVGHELGTPLSEITSAVKGLSEQKLPGPVAKELSSLDSASQRIAAILDSLRMDLDPGDTALAVRQSDGSWNSVEATLRQVTNVNTMIEVAESAVKRVRRDKNVTYSHQYSANCCIMCVPSEIVQILINVFRNAYDSFRLGRGQIHIRTLREKEHSGESGESHERVRMVIRDSGEGISAESLDRIFQQGFSTRSGSGRGFGLTIVKELAERNGGSVAIFSPTHHGSAKLDPGTEIVLTFPRVPCQVHSGETK